MLILGLIGFHFSANAQLLNRIVNHAADKVDEKIDKALDKAAEKPGSQQDQAQMSTVQNARPHVLQAQNVYDFVAGNQVIFKDNFDRDSLETFPRQWKTNGSGSVVTVSGIPGRWFLLNPDATFKPDSLLSPPDHFTVEFDVLALCDKVDDLSPLIFGFDGDNSVGSYETQGSANVSLLYFNENEYTAYSTGLDKYYSGNYTFENTVNQPMHVAIRVNDAHMAVYLDKTKILDADMFLADARKYFFISAPMNYDHGAQLLIGNVRIAK